MRLILDTHAFLWFINDSPQLSPPAAELLESGNELLLSTASLWEVAIKLSIGKLALPAPYEAFIAEQLKLNVIEVLPITVPHLAVVATLPLHHRDPFDRLLAAQALVEQVPLVSKDPSFDQYGLKRLW